MSNVQPPSPYPGPGEIIGGKYQIERMLGEGGMGAVAKAVHIELRAVVALKFMNPQFVSFPGAVERFRQEGIASRAIKSEHVVKVDDVGYLPSGTPFLVMDCLEGADLQQVLQREGTPGLPVERAVHFMLQILRGLQAAHATGIVHRDMKPSNCFVVKHEGEPDFVKLLDFGISKVKAPGSASLTQTNSALGTPLYMSPEQARSPRDVDARSDIYSVGVILYELLTGHTPFMSETGEFTEILFKLFTAEVPPIKDARPDLPDGLAEVVHKALAREVDQRWQSAGEFAEALFPYAGARSKEIIKRLQTWTPDSRSVVPPPISIPPSAMAPSAYGQSHPPALVVTPAPEHLTANPVNPAMQARPEEAGARTQASVPRVVAGAGTNLSLSKDAPPESKRTPGEAKKSPAMLFAIPVIALVLGAGLVVGIKMKGSATKDPGTSAGGGIVYSAASMSPPQPPLPSATTSVATSTSPDAGAVPSAAVSAKPSATVAVRPPGPGSATTTATTVAPPPTTGSGRLNTTLMP
jgi:serine/threonine-protein kinase